MFCPNCGGQNQDDLVVYCRECGENLQVVSQAMKGHLSVALVTRIDAVIEKRNERLRRDAILGALTGSAFLFSGILGLLEGNALLFLKVLSVVAGVFAYLLSVWKLLGFRRSVELKARHHHAPAVSEKDEHPAISASPEVSITMQETSSAESEPIYCPKCGMKNSGEASFCPSCGMGLALAYVPAGMERYMPRFLLTWLDRGVAKNEETPFRPQYRSWSAIMVVAGVFLFAGIGNLIEHYWSGAVTNFVLGLTLVVSGSWNLVAYQRTAAKETEPHELAPTSRLDAIGPFLLASWKTVLAVLAVCAGLIWYFGIIQAVPLVLVALLILIGALLKFWQRQNDQFFLNRSSLPTSELSVSDSLETTPLGHRPLSITEPTTRFLDPLMDNIELEKAPTTQKLADPRR